MMDVMEVLSHGWTPLDFPVGSFFTDVNDRSGERGWRMDVKGGFGEEFGCFEAEEVGAG
jgi:hypothetical protein